MSRKYSFELEEANSINKKCKTVCYLLEFMTFKSRYEKLQITLCPTVIYRYLFSLSKDEGLDLKEV